MLLFRVEAEFEAITKGTALSKMGITPDPPASSPQLPSLLGASRVFRRRRGRSGVGVVRGEPGWLSGQSFGRKPLLAPFLLCLFWQPWPGNRVPRLPRPDR